MEYKNQVEFEVFGEYGLFSDPITRIGGEKFTYQVPTYEAIKGILHSIYWKPTIIWVVDRIRVMNPIQTETKGIRPIKYATKGNDLSYYTYLKNCRYKVQAHFIWNENRPELVNDRNENKHYSIAKRMIERGGRRDVFLGTRECQAYVIPCDYKTGVGSYDKSGELSFGLMYHGITYADEAYSNETQGAMTVNFWNCIMKSGEIAFLEPQFCIHKMIHKMKVKPFGEEYNNFSRITGFGEENGNVMDESALPNV